MPTIFVFVQIKTLRPSKDLARAIHRKKSPVIFERSERPARHATPFPSKKSLTCVAGSSLRLRMTDARLRVEERIGFSKVSIRKPVLLCGSHLISALTSWRVAVPAAAEP